MLEFCTHIFNTDLVLETEQKTLYPFLVKIYLLCTHYFQVYVGDQGAKNYVRELRWFLIDLW